MGTWTNAGLTLVANAVQSAGTNAAITYVALSTGCGTISAAITAGVPLTSITLDANVPANLSSGQSLTINDGTNSETFTTSGSVTGGTTPTIPINSWTPAHSYAAHVSGIAPTPAGNHISLYNETLRVIANPGSAGAAAGESLNAAYFDGTQASGIFLLAGFYGGGTASATLGSGIFMGEDIIFWNHTLNADSNMVQADNQL